MRIGFDMDGVLLNDLHFDRIQDVDLIHYMRKMTIPMFDPSFILRPTYLVTGRPEIDRATTESWVKEHFGSSIELCMGVDRCDFDIDCVSAGAKFKAKTIMEKDIGLFFESNSDQCGIIREILKKAGCNAKIVHFASFINTRIIDMIWEMENAKG